MVYRMDVQDTWTGHIQSAYAADCRAPTDTELNFGTVANKAIDTCRAVFGQLNIGYTQLMVAVYNATHHVSQTNAYVHPSGDFCYNNFGQG